MKELTNELKARFFAQYWGQKVFEWLPNHRTKYFLDHVGEQIFNYSDCGILLLKPLFSISDEDAIEVAKIYKESINASQFPKWFKVQDYVDCGKAYAGRKEITIEVFDYLRSKGYAIPFMGISVEEMIEAGWIKLTVN